MNPMKSDLPGLNPREILKKEGPQGLARLLAGTGYMVQERVLGDMVQAIKSGIPHFIEGPRGAGKTAFGEALGAYEFAGRENVVPILIVDEIDKLKDRIEDMLLQLFGRGYSHVPRFGDVGVKDSNRWPIVILLSNDIRHDLSAPMRSRCIYTWIDLPTPREGVRILCSRVPEAQAELVTCVAKLLDCIRDIPGVVDKPALREGISLLKAFARDEVSIVDEPVLVEYLCHLAKRRGDRDYLLQSMARVEQMVNSSDREIDAWVAEEFSSRRRASLRAA